MTPAGEAHVLTVADDSPRQRRLEELAARVTGCRRCRLGDTRTSAVFGSGTVGARVMFVGEAPGYHEDRQGKPFVGQAGQLLEKLLGRISLTREDVFIANVLKCRPPNNRDPHPEEIELCRGHLHEQIDIIQPQVICSLGNFATKLLSGKPDGISRVRGVAQRYPGGKSMLLFPVFHPAAALYTPGNLAVLEGDFDRLGGLISPRLADETQEASEASSSVKEKTQAELEPQPAPPHPPEDSGGSEQLGLF